MSKPQMTRIERIIEIRKNLDILMAHCLATPPTEREQYRSKIEPLAKEYHELHDGQAWYTYRHVTGRNHD